MNNIVQQYYHEPIALGGVSDESFSYHEGNPVCDDALTVSVRIENDCIAAIGFQGEISLPTHAAASYWHERVTDESIDSVLKMNYYTMAEDGYEVSVRRQMAAVLPLVALYNGIYQRQGSEHRCVFDDVL